MSTAQKTAADVKRQFWANYRARLFATPRAWAHTGEKLIHAFEAVADATVEHSMHLNMRAQAFMLAGMAVEMLLKAMIVHDPAVRPIVAASKASTTDKRLWTIFYSHRLSDMARVAKVPLNAQRRKTADMLSRHVYWRGRYLVPNESAIVELMPVRGDDGLMGSPRASATIVAVRELIAHVVNETKARLYAT